MRKLGFAFALAAAAALSAGGANANTIIISRDLTFDAPPGQTMVMNFDDPSASGYNWSGDPGYSTTGSLVDEYSPPVILVGGVPTLDPTIYGYLPQGVAILSIPNGLSGVSIYIGSLDPYNSIGFDSNGTVTWFTADELAAAPGPSLFGSARYYFDFNGTKVDAIEFATPQPAFEIDNIAAAVPESSIWALLLMGFGMIGLALRGMRSKRPDGAIA